MFRKNLILLFLFFLILFPIPLDARKRAPLPAHVTTSHDGGCYFKMRPNPTAPTSKQSGIGELYVVSAIGSDRLLWRTEGWYAYTVYITGDCNTLVRFGLIGPGQRPNPDSLAIAFFWQGKLVRSYTLQEIVKWDFNKPWPSSPSKNERLYYHAFLSDLPYVEKRSGLFIVNTIDGQRHQFSLDTRNFGNIVNK